MPWIQLIFETNSEQVPLFDDLLPELGAMAITLEDNADQPLYEPPLGSSPVWEKTRVVGLFNANADIDLIVNLLKPHFQDSLPRWRIEILEDQNWERAWIERFKPMRMGKRLWICPSWCEPPEPEAINVLLDPGLAFGTGTHPTTALCLQKLDAIDLDGKVLVDYGCGSGILAIAACLLGCNEVWAVDNDPQALISCSNNAEKNGVLEKLNILSPEAFNDQFQGHADAVVANILAAPLQQLTASLVSLLKPNGQLILSGILQEQENDVVCAYKAHIQFENTSRYEEWIRLDGRLTK